MIASLKAELAELKMQVHQVSLQMAGAQNRGDSETYKTLAIWWADCWRGIGRLTVAIFLAEKAEAEAGEHGRDKDGVRGADLRA